MRFSFLAVIAVAVIVGLGVVFAAKHYGWLDKKETQQVVSNPPVVVQQPPPVIVVPPPPPQVLAPVNVLYAGDAINPNDVQPRELRDDEIEEYKKNKDDYLPAVRSIVHFRMPARDLPVDRPLRKGDLLEAKKPESLSARLAPGTRAVGVQIPKENSVGGLIQVGDWVDVYLITDVSRTDNPLAITHTALLAPHAQVVAKRDTLYPLYIAPTPGEPFPFTLSTNPYRAALIEYARTVGTLALVPVSSDEKKRLDALREEAMKDPTKTLAVTFADPSSPDYKTEEERVARHSKGQLSVGPDDLSMTLNLKPIEPPMPPPPPPKRKIIIPAEPPPPPPPPVTVELFSGVSKSGSASFAVPYVAPPPGKPTVIEEDVPAPPWVPPPTPRYVFSRPGDDQGAGADLPPADAPRLTR